MFKRANAVVLVCNFDDKDSLEYIIQVIVAIKKEEYPIKQIIAVPSWTAEEQPNRWEEIEVI